MNIKKIIKKFISITDEALLTGYLSIVGDTPGIRGLLFHTVFSNDDEIALDYVLPQQHLTVRDYRLIFEYFLEYDYKFIGYNDLATELSADGKYVYVTFDDGYSNNQRIVPLIEELSIPIHLFVTTGNIIENKKYWWDIVYQQRTKSGFCKSVIESELTKLKKYEANQINCYLVENFGDDSFKPLTDIDRPLHPQELRDMAEHELISIGNHTRNHAIVTVLAEDDVRAEIVGAQEELIDLTGQNPRGFAFPNGNYRKQDLDLLKSMEIDLAFSCEPRINRIPGDLIGERRLSMGRHCFSGSSDLGWQGKISRAGSSPFLEVQKLKSRLYR